MWKKIPVKWHRDSPLNIFIKTFIGKRDYSGILYSEIIVLNGIFPTHLMLVFKYRPLHIYMSVLVSSCVYEYEFV